MSPELSTFSVLGFGFLLGLWHAKDPDHLAAVSTIVAEKKSLLNSMIVGGFWGVGHTLAILVVGMLVIFLKLQISEAMEARLEAVVGAMLVLLGLNALVKLFRKSTIHIHTHEHDGLEHTHVHTHKDEKKEEAHHFRHFSPRSVAIGMVHGLAGSAGVMLLVLPTIDTPAVAILYMVLFGVGSIAGMMLMSLLIGLPIHLTAGRFSALNKSILGAAGLLSLGLGVFIIYEKLLV
ncbi:MAG: urease accessory protein [Acidobacteria bacterium]|nr:MAG: urease accessory protein [Acidobacteriota bacterium]REJ99053.1 MAG: urease accessory protein [Acidobacteriota bacterium]REK16226.1 MAG: urease accessory protein [Acidobacteriota bacterium]REK43907.1 MAG: urease accessory protein [Acidobacteriota bacterium]